MEETPNSALPIQELVPSLCCRTSKELASSEAEGGGGADSAHNLLRLLFLEGQARR